MRWTPGYRELAPPRPLRLAVACFWIQVVPPQGAPPTLVMPDGCIDLIWQRGRGVHVAGPDTQPMPTLLSPGTMLVGARFRPGTGGSALGLPLHELRNQRIDLFDLRPSLAKQFSGESTPATLLHALRATVAEMVTERPPDPLVRQASRLLAHPQARAETLARELGLSERQLRRRFHANVGYGPKTLQEVLRFRRFLSLMTTGQGEGQLARIALDVGYADQAHLTREVVRFSGLPPTALMKTRTT